MTDPVKSITIPVKGSYDPSNGNWTASALSGAANVGYYFSGVFDSSGASPWKSVSITTANSTGTGYTPWQQFVFPITDGSYSGSQTGTFSGGLPQVFWGPWHGYSDSDGTAYDVIISPWTIKLMMTYSNGKKELENFTIVKVTDNGGGAYRFIYTKTMCKTTAAETKAFFEYILPGITITEYHGATEPSNPAGIWVWDDGEPGELNYGGFSDAQWKEIYDAYFANAEGLYMAEYGSSVFYDVFQVFDTVDLTVNAGGASFTLAGVNPWDSSKNSYEGWRNTLADLETDLADATHPPQTDDPPIPFTRQ